jgi:hypothetical protein
MTLASRNMEVSDIESPDLEVSIDEICAVLSKDEFDEFISVMIVVQDILDNESKYVGSYALIAAAKLAALRTKLSIRAQYYKTSEKSIIQRRRKDLLISMYQALEENINTLKLLGRVEAKVSGII